MTIRNQWETVCFFIIMTATMLFFTFLFSPIAHGTAIEDPLPTLKDKLLERAREWNLMQEINKTLELADKWNEEGVK